LNHIVGMFSNGNFNAPMLIHDTTYRLNVTAASGSVNIG
jgi:hypothetical protein